MTNLSTKVLRSLAVATVLFGSFTLKAAAGTADSANHYATLARQEFSAQHYPAALRYYEQAAKANPNDADIQLGIVDAALKMNKQLVALRALENVVRLKPGDNQIAFRMVEMQFNSGQYEKTLELGRPLMQKAPDTKGLAFMLGKSAYQKQDYAAATPYLKKAVKETPDNAEVHYLLGRMLVQMSNYANAISYYAKSLSLDSTTQPMRYYEYAQVLAMAEQYDESVKWFERALNKGLKARDDFYMNYAYTLADAKKTEKALDVFNRMLLRRPQDLALLGGMADVCYHSGRFKDAIGYWDRVLSMKKDDARTIYHIGLAYIKMGKDSEGKALCDKAIELEPALGVLRHDKSMPF